MASAWTTGTTMTELRSEDGLPWMSSPGFLSQYPPSPSQFPLLPGLNYPTIPSLSSSEPGIRHSSYLPSERIPQESAADPLPANPSIADPNPSANPSRDLSNVGALFEGTHTSLPPLPDFRFIDVRNRLSDQSSELASPGSAPREEVEVGLAF
ncbi:hypothetical protein OF83DRAFT_363639 [Amylostereum chailletii]|nr:hypothetical protein OF83DRAFT_363639 [Amylostereum chailletii]